MIFSNKIEDFLILFLQDLLPECRRPSGLGQSNHSTACCLAKDPVIIFETVLLETFPISYTAGLQGRTTFKARCWSLEPLPDIDCSVPVFPAV